MTSPVDRRTALKLLAATLAAPAVTLPAADPAPAEKWRTAIGLNGFQSGSRKYKKNYPIWEVPDPYDACLKCKRAFDQAWP